jgi:hypothetical protein
VKPRVPLKRIDITGVNFRVFLKRIGISVVNLENSTEKN